MDCPEELNQPAVQLKQPRKSRPKVKSGCRTCKARRVKCDETRPECQRCVKAGRPCEGYPLAMKGPPRLIAPKHLARHETLYPRSRPELRADRVVEPTSPSATTPRSLSTNLFDDQLEGNYFSFYCSTTSKKLGGYWDVPIWGRLILQACHEEPFVRHAIVSIAALDLAMEKQPPCSSTGSSSEPNAIAPEADRHNAHYAFALKEYGKALRLMRASHSSDEAHYVRKALISCLLIICFEAYRGDPSLATTQAQTAIKILSQWLRKRSKDSANVVDEELVKVFARLYKLMMLFRTERPAEFTQLLQPKAITKMENMPSRFQTLSEAREYWEYYLRLSMPWNQQPGHDSLQTMAFPKSHPDTIRGREPIATPLPNDEAVTTRLETERLGHVRTIERWLVAFQPIWDACQTQRSSHGYAEAAIIRMQTRCGLIAFATAATNHECHYDEFHNMFTEIVTLSRDVLEVAQQTRTSSPPFAFSIGVTNSLYLVLVKCRERQLRRQALQLLDDHPRRDGVWDTAMVAAIGRWIAEEEEKGLEPDEPVPEAARMRLMEVKMPTNKKEVHIRYTLMETSVRERRIAPTKIIIFS